MGPRHPAHKKRNDGEATLIESMLGDFSPEEFTDTHTQRVQDLIEAKAQDAEFVTKPEATEDTSDLLAALEASVARHPAGRKRAKKSAVA